MSRRTAETVACTREFRVQVTSWELHDIWLKATSEAKARRDAEHIWH
ncbi:hypothetical protein [Oceaniradius stylonematis]